MTEIDIDQDIRSTEGGNEANLSMYGHSLFLDAIFFHCKLEKQMELILLLVLSWW